MIVCECLEISLKDIEKDIIQLNFNKEEIECKTEVGSICGCCVKSKCHKVDLTLDEAIEKIRKRFN